MSSKYGTFVYNSLFLILILILDNQIDFNNQHVHIDLEMDMKPLTNLDKDEKPLFSFLEGVSADWIVFLMYKMNWGRAGTSSSTYTFFCDLGASISVRTTRIRSPRHLF